MVCCKTLTTLSPDQWLLNLQDPVLAPYGSPSTANRWPHRGGGSYPSVEVQSTYSTAPADRAVVYESRHLWNNGSTNVRLLLNNLLPKYTLFNIFLYVWLSNKDIGTILVNLSTNSNLKSKHLSGNLKGS